MTRELDWEKTNGLIPAVIQDADTRNVLMLGYMSPESLELTRQTGKVTFYSRSRQALWVKGETSGHFLDVVAIHTDCDGDTILIEAKPHGPTCHEGTTTCFGEMPAGDDRAGIGFLNELSRIIDDRFEHPGEGSYVASLIKRGLDRMAQKVGEEAVETVIAAKNQDQDTFESEAADLLFHLMVLLRAKGSSLAILAEVLRERHSVRATKD